MPIYDVWVYVFVLPFYVHRVGAKFPSILLRPMWEPHTMNVPLQGGTSTNENGVFVLAPVWCCAITNEPYLIGIYFFGQIYSSTEHKGIFFCKNRFIHGTMYTV